VDLGELVRFRELLYFLVWSELKVRYKQTVLGAAWAVIQPFSVMVVFAIFFGLVVRVPTGEIPYPVFAYSGLVVWTYFSVSLTTASNSLVARERLITKVYFPRLLVPLSAILAGLVDLFIAFVVLLAMVLVYGFPLSPALLTLPLFVLLAAGTALAVSLWLSALNVRYRDVKLLVPVAVQLWFYATPIIYPASLVPGEWRTPYELLNPMVGVIEGFRWAVLGVGVPPSLTVLAISALGVTALAVGGLYYFRRVERSFADVV
jgi:lipopolysaccharide transport system permease protein